MSEMVNHPQHYCREGRKECIEEMKEKFGKVNVAIFCVLNAYKYRYRAGLKDGNTAEQDIKKAEWYENYAKRKVEKMDKDFEETKKFLNSLLNILSENQKGN